MKKVLIVSYVFPPMAAVGGQRIVNFCKFLPKFGWTPVVLTVKGGVNASWDPTPLEKIPETIIYRSRSFEPLIKREMKKTAHKKSFQAEDTASFSTPSRTGLSWPARLKRFIRLSLSVPDFALLWVPFGVWKGWRVLRRENISVIMSSSPPVSAHIIASILSRLSGLPHLVDFRDLWTLNHNYNLRGYPGYFKNYDQSWERFVLRNAALVTTASPGFSRQMEAHLGGLLKGKTTTVTNGFDYGEVDLDEGVPPDGPGRIRFLYTGALYTHFNPVFFLESLALWINEDRIDPSTVVVDFYGNSDYDYGEWVAQLGLSNIVHFHGFVPRDKLLPVFRRTDHVLLLLGFQEETKNVIPAKLFEYLASGAEILALAPEGVAAELIRKYEAGRIICRPNKNEMAAMLRQIYQVWRNSPPRERKYRYIEDIDRRKLTGRLAELLEALISPRQESNLLEKDSER